MIVVTRNHLWLVDSHHEGPSNVDVTSVTKIIKWLQKYSWYHLWDHLSCLILDTSATANVLFNSDFILLNEFSNTYLHQASKHQQQIHVKTELDPISLQISILAFIFLCFFLSCYPHFHIVSFLSCFFFFPISFFLLPFFLLLFFQGKIVSLSPSRLLPFFCYFFSYYFFSYPKLLFFPVPLFPVTFFPSTPISNPSNKGLGWANKHFRWSRSITRDTHRRVFTEGWWTPSSNMRYNMAHRLWEGLYCGTV